MSPVLRFICIVFFAQTNGQWTDIFFDGFDKLCTHECNEWTASDEMRVTWTTIDASCFTDRCCEIIAGFGYDQYIYRNIDISGYSSVRLQFDVTTEYHLYNDDAFRIYYSYTTDTNPYLPSTAYETVTSYSDSRFTRYTNYEVDLPPPTSNSLWFWVFCPDTDSYATTPCFFDNVYVKGIAAPSPAPTLSPTKALTANTNHPSLIPSQSPTLLPSQTPTDVPSQQQPQTTVPSTFTLVPSQSPFGEIFTSLPSELPSGKIYATFPDQTSANSIQESSQSPPMESYEATEEKEEATAQSAYLGDLAPWIGIALIVFAVAGAITMIYTVITCLRKERKMTTDVIDIHKENDAVHIVKEDDVLVEHKEDLQGENNLDLVAVWLRSTVGLPQYYTTFIQNGYISLVFISNIRDKSELDEIGINIKGHQTQLIVHIEELKKAPGNPNEAKIENGDDDEVEGEGNGDGDDDRQEVEGNANKTTTCGITPNDHV